MKFKISLRTVIKLILFVHVALSIFDLRFLILPWVYIGLNLWTLATKPFGAQWVPAEMHKVRTMLKLVDIKPGEILYDLGCGDGRIVIEASKAYKAKAVGIEIDPIRALISRLKVRYNNLQKHVNIEHANFFNVNLKDADVVALYLLPETLNKLQSKFRQQLKHGSRIVSLKFPLSNWKPVRVDKKNDIFVYKI